MFPLLLPTISGAWNLWLKYLWRWCQWIIAMLKWLHHRKINLPSFVFFVWLMVIHWVKRNGREFFWGSCLLIHYLLKTGKKWLRKLKFIENYFSGKVGCVSWRKFWSSRSWPAFVAALRGGMCRFCGWWKPTVRGTGSIGNIWTDQQSFMFKMKTQGFLFL